jgi:hypothetical protein
MQKGCKMYAYWLEGVMPLLQVRDIPEDLYEAISKIAKQEHRSIAQETIILLRKSLGLTEERMTKRKRVIKEINDLAKDGSKSKLDPAEVIRQDRDR